MTESVTASAPALIVPRLEIKRTVHADDALILVDFLHQHSGLSKQQLKDAANKGAVLLRRAGSARRVRRAKTELRSGDRIELHYDRDLLALQPPAARCIADHGSYSLWYKPAGLLAQGNEFGDHSALTRQAELAWTPPRQVWVIHRLDREAAGLMLLAHSKQAAAKLSQQFQHNQVQKQYRVQVLGNIGAVLGQQGCIDQALDGKAALTDFQVLDWDAQTQRSTLQVTIHTGRLHQIRRHFAEAGFPVIGDPRYGTGNKTVEGLRLVAVSLAFLCPQRRTRVAFELAPEDIGF
jgi:tRNA pseudouridine32 synthase/23S rRNA pseudouridine746 synthase